MSMGASREFGLGRVTASFLNLENEEAHISMELSVLTLALQDGRRKHLDLRSLNP